MTSFIHFFRLTVKKTTIVFSWVFLFCLIFRFDMRNFSKNFYINKCQIEYANTNIPTKTHSSQFFMCLFDLYPKSLFGVIWLETLALCILFHLIRKWLEELKKLAWFHQTWFVWAHEPTTTTMLLFIKRKSMPFLQQCVREKERETGPRVWAFLDSFKFFSFTFFFCSNSFTHTLLLSKQTLILFLSLISKSFHF